MVRILLIDDSEKVLESMGAALRRRGDFVTCTNNGKDAIALLVSSPGRYDVVVLDIRMPGMDGNAVIRAMPASAPPVVVTTGTDAAVEDYVGTKVKCVLTKPYDADDLTKAVARVLTPDSVLPPTA